VAACTADIDFSNSIDFVTTPTRAAATPTPRSIAPLPAMSKLFLNFEPVVSADLPTPSVATAAFAIEETY
jgi:hypothetical protein